MFISILISIFLVVSSPSLLVSWVGLELNTIAFLPLMLIQKSKLSREGSIKYFLTQTLASILVFLGGVCFFGGLAFLGDILVLVGLSIKLGAAPFHRWILSVAEGVGWGVLFILLTLQKVNPLAIMWGFGVESHGVLEGVIIISLVLGASMGLVQTSTRLLITFSSINHLGWLLTTLMFDIWLGVCYFIIYLVTLFPVVYIMYTFNISHINELFLLNFPLGGQLILFLCLLSLAGLPPFLGFLPKWLVLQWVLGGGLVGVSLIIILARLFTLFFYLRVGFSAFIIGGRAGAPVIGPLTISVGGVLSLVTSLAGLPVFIFV